MQFTAKQLSEILNAEIDGDPEKIVNSVARIEEADVNAISFIANDKYNSLINTSRAGIIIVDRKLPRGNNVDSTLLRVEDPYSSFAILIENLTENNHQKKSGIEGNTSIGENSVYGENFYLGAFSCIGNNVTIGKNVKIYPNSYIGDGSKIGDNTVIFSSVNIYHECEVGSDCIIHAGAVLGSDGFGFAPQKDGSFKKIIQSGNVVLEDHVEIGANTVIDRATIGSTRIHKGAKLDNLVQIAHNVEIGNSTVIAAQVGISGSSKVGNYCMIGGQAGLVGHITIADKTRINAQSGVTKKINNPETFLTGSPAYNYRSALRNEVMVRQLPELLKRIQDLENEIKDLKGNV
ncbi:MAG: UDP-3-O-(3-hydroxymyristoyl)glucosamine N-acyltransferase [Chitinophagales bacterium]|nr:UDP-3-O-(3-hydroxymyristoyl)glucosamine N-acyltransferase [Chitinophagales bacterium]